MDRFASLVASIRQKIPLDPKQITNIRTDFNNWVVPGRIMCGPYPGVDGLNFPTEVEALKNINDIVNDGINVMVCLQQEEQLVNGQPRYSSLVGNKLQYLHFPIEDQNIPSHKVFVQHMTLLLELLLQGKNIFIHCLGGHGRTGTYVAALLMIMYGLDSRQAIYYTQYFHNLRRIVDKRLPMGIPCMSPNSDIQIDFVKQFESFLRFAT
jgi:hypothetical protein